MGGGGTYIGLSRQQTSALPKTGVADTGGTGTGGGTGRPRTVPYQYTVTLACGGNTPESPGGEAGCAAAFQTCEHVENADGPYVTVFRRTAAPSNPPGGAPTYGTWQNVGTTCWPQLVPNAAAKPQLTLAMITAQWRRTNFAKPQVVTQPVGGRTLVGLPTYFQLTWPTAGFEPGETDTVTMLGHQVRIKPTFRSNVFHFGDGSSQATTSNGGPYPSGDVTHTYEHKAGLRVSITTTYGGQYSVDGSAWADIPGTLAIPGPASDLAVVAARNDLVVN